MKKFLLFSAFLLFVLLHGTAQNQTNLRSVNAGGRVLNADTQNNSWQYSFGEVFSAPIGTDPTFTQGFNQPDFINDIGLVVYKDSLHESTKIENQTIENVVIGIDTGRSSIKREFILQNNGLFGELKIDSVKFKNNYFEVDESVFSIQNGETDSLTISLIPETVSTYLDTIFIYSNSLVNSVYVFPVYGEITKELTPELGLFLSDTNSIKLTSGDEIDFGILNSNEDSIHTFVIKNYGLGELRIKSVATDNVAFQMLELTNDTLVTNQDLVFEITFSNSKTNLYSGELQIISNDPLFDTLHIKLKGEIVKTSTWVNGEWTNGVPDSATVVFIEDVYSTSEKGGIKANRLYIKPGGKLQIDDNLSLIEVDSIINTGEITRWCLNETTFTKGFNGNPVFVEQPEIITNDLLEAVFEQSYRATFQVSQMENANWVFSEDSLPLSLSVSKNVLEGIPVEIGTFEIIVHATEASCSAVDTFSLEVVNLDDPYLWVPSAFTVSCNTPTFRLEPRSDSRGDFSYELIKPNNCLSLDENTGDVKILCAEGREPAQVKITQQRTAKYRTVEETTSIYFVKDSISLGLELAVFDFFSKSDTLKVITASSAQPIFSLLGEFSNTINLETIGRVDFLAEGKVPVVIEIPESSCHTRLKDTLEIEVIKGTKPPIAINDTIRLSLYDDGGYINVLDNDSGVTALLDSFSVVLIQNEQLYNQGSRYYKPELGYLTLNYDEILGLVEVESNDISLGTTLITYEVKDRDGEVASAQIVIIVTVPPDKVAPKLEYKEFFSPNGDGKNEVFLIKFLNKENPGDLTVIDRLGNQVYYRENYINDWDFTLEDGRKVDDGTYFFIYIEEAQDKLQGSFEIKR